MNPNELKERTIEFAVRVLKFADALPNTASDRTVANQVARSGCTVAANYRSALRGKSRPDFVNKITIVLEGADETGVWIEIAKRRGPVPANRIADLQAESVELTKIFAATRTTARNHKS
ncbi:MAG TPA: four helix bundle protein [Opitutus sp.]|nr:four helix bundle protein [Opitutus sp.]